MKKIEYPIENSSFAHNGVMIDCKYALKLDKTIIIRNGRRTHREEFVKCYDSKSLKPKKINLYVDKDNNPVYGYIVYTIHNKKADYDRLAVGGYYPIWENKLMPHPYQTSVCW